MILQKTFLIFSCFSTLLSGCTAGLPISPSQIGGVPPIMNSSPPPYVYIPVHCEESKIPETLKVVQGVASGSIIEINMQEDCKKWLDILEVPKSIQQAMSQEQYRAVILGDDSSMGPRASFTPDEWQWLKNLNTQLIINSDVDLIFPGSSRTADYTTLFEILPILETGAPKKYANMVEYSKKFPTSLTQEDIQKCDALVPGAFTYSGSQTLYDTPKEYHYPAIMQGFKDRAHCYAKVIR